MGMRVTSNMLTNNLLANLNNNANSVARYQQQLASGRSIVNLSDDPVGVYKSMRARVKIARLEQYKENVVAARTWINEAETIAREVNSVLTKAYELTVQASSDTYTDGEGTARGAIAREIEQLRNHIFDAMNSRELERYIFGGFNTTSAPFTLDVNGEIMFNGVLMNAPFTGSDERVEFETGAGIRMDVTVSGVTMMGLDGDNMYTVLTELMNELDDPDSRAGDISPFITRIKDLAENVLNIATELGAKMNRLDFLEARYDEDIVTYTDVKSRVEDVDEAEAAMRYKMAETIYQAALQTGAGMLRMSLLDYLN
ncbi:MAG: flagellar hook-associated protein FlgL [Clostridiales bacterium]|jgi:flagellar hook-associated protein 3 FlgL|nr:flagellar hook-associated protein FlgL [Clostridiales bacterium]